MSTYVVMVDYKGKTADFHMESDSIKVVKQAISRTLTGPDWNVVGVLHI